jgi:hypothetical protein
VLFKFNLFRIAENKPYDSVFEEVLKENKAQEGINLNSPGYNPGCLAKSNNPKRNGHKDRKIYWLNF